MLGKTTRHSWAILLFGRRREKRVFVMRKHRIFGAVRFVYSPSRNGMYLAKWRQTASRVVAVVVAVVVVVVERNGEGKEWLGRAKRRGVVMNAGGGGKWWWARMKYTQHLLLSLGSLEHRKNGKRRMSRVPSSFSILRCTVSDIPWMSFALPLCTNNNLMHIDYMYAQRVSVPTTTTAGDTFGIRCRTLIKWRMITTTTATTVCFKKPVP